MISRTTSASINLAIRDAGPRATSQDLFRFACICCRRVEHLTTHRDCRAALDTIEGVVAGRMPVEQLQWYWGPVSRVALRGSWADDAVWQLLQYARNGYLLTATAPDSGYSWYRNRLREVAMSAARHAAQIASKAVRASASGRPGRHAARREEDAQQCLFACILGDPTPSLPFARGWLTPTVRSLLQSTDVKAVPLGDDDGHFAVVADALEEAGCDRASLLSHLRQRGPHVPECWAMWWLLSDHEAPRPYRERGRAPSSHGHGDPRPAGA